MGKSYRKKLARGAAVEVSKQMMLMVRDFTNGTGDDGFKSGRPGS
jgi:hypothetical protein